MESETLILAIDPGAGGALVLLDKERDVLGMALLPTSYFPTYWMRVRDFLLAARERGEVAAVIEKVWGLPGQAGGNLFSRYYGVMLGQLIAFDIPFIEVPPQTWQAVYLPRKGEGRPANESEKQRTARLNADRTERKGKLVEIAQRLFPNISVEASGLADALLIGNWKIKVDAGEIAFNPNPRKRRRRRKGRSRG